MKTIEEWLEELNEPERSQALKNFFEQDLRYTGYVDRASIAISYAFTWGQTPEGWQYWHELALKLADNEYQKSKDNETENN